MKMKKFISLLLAACTIASFATVASAAEEPTMKLVAEKIDFDGEYAEYAADYDWSEYEDADAGLFYDTYSLKVVATGLDVVTASRKEGKATVFYGDSIVGYQVQIAVDTEGTYYDDWQWGLIKAIAEPTGAPDENGAALVATGTKPLEPAAGVAKTIGKDDETVILEFLVTVDASKPVNFTFDDYAVFLAKFDNLTKAPTDTYAYKALDNSMTTSTPTFAVPTVDTPVVPDPVLPEVTVSDKIDVAAGSIVGAAWDVTIKNFDSAKAYVAKFTDEATGTSRDEGKAIDVAAFAETTGDVGFAVILKLTADRNVALTVDVQ